MPSIDIVWDLPDDPYGNVQHIAEHGLIPLDVEHAMNHPTRLSRSRSSGLPIVFGRIPSGKVIAVIYEEINDNSIYPITAYEVEE